jgi:hypothetical protein
MNFEFKGSTSWSQMGVILITAQAADATVCYVAIQHTDCSARAVEYCIRWSSVQYVSPSLRWTENGVNKGGSALAQQQALLD